MNIYIVGVLIVGYLAFSLFYKKAHRYLYDLFWRAIIIAWVYFTSADTIAISDAQWYILIGIFVTSYLIAIVASRASSIYENFVAVVAAPITEEFLFRGFVLSVVVGTDFNRALIVSVLFALWHLKNIRVLGVPSLIYQIIYAFFLGFPLSYLALYSDSLFLPIVLHTINNTLAVSFGRSLFRKKREA